MPPATSSYAPPRSQPPLRQQPRLRRRRQRPQSPLRLTPLRRLPAQRPPQPRHGSPRTRRRRRSRPPKMRRLPRFLREQQRGCRFPWYSVHPRRPSSPRGHAPCAISAHCALPLHLRDTPAYRGDPSASPRAPPSLPPPQRRYQPAAPHQVRDGDLRRPASLHPQRRPCYCLRAARRSSQPRARSSSRFPRPPAERPSKPSAQRC
mmetsp:Transcript_10763/g.28783  ORF Transcript_10763/g.28783 Transcript_10763/m.28783 type:complete len:205 (-) Transcript_10763:99-713(-)